MQVRAVYQWFTRFKKLDAIFVHANTKEMGIEAVKYEGNHEHNIKTFDKRIRKRRQTRQWKNVFDAAQNGDLSAVQRYIEQQHVDVNASLPGNTGNLVSAAAQEGHIDIVRYLISRGADVNTKDRYGYNSLLWVLDKNKTSLNVIQLLVENGADVNVQAKENGYTPLHWAVIHNRLNVVQYLVGRNADLDSRTKEGLTPIQEASKRQLTDIVGYLTITNQNRFANTSGDISEAAAAGDVNAMRHFVESEHKDPFEINSSGETALHIAAANGKLSVVKYLLEMKTRNVNIANARGESPLMSATTRGHLDVIRYLIEDKHANPDAVDKAGFTPLLAAARSGNSEIVRYLVNRGNVNMKAAERDYSNNALHIAAQNGHAHIVVFLVDEKKFNIYSKNKYGETALHVAARYGNLPIVAYFIDDKGMDFALVNTKGRNVLHTAVEGGNLEVLRYLVDEKHADITTKDSYQNTVLHIAVESNQLQLVKHLTEVRGFDATILNSSGLNAVMVAKTYSRQQILNYFVNERKMTLTGINGNRNPNTNPSNSDELPLANLPTIFTSADISNNIQRPSYDNYYASYSPVEKPNSETQITKASKPAEQFVTRPQFNFQTTQEVLTEGDTITVKQHYLINGKEVDKSTMDKAIMDFMKASAAESNSNRVTWGQQIVTDANGIRTKYIVNGQEVAQDYYDNIIRQYGSGNPNAVSSTYYDASSAGLQFAPLQYYSTGKRRKRNSIDVPAPSPTASLGTPLSWLLSKNTGTGLLVASESRNNSAGGDNLWSKLDVSGFKNFLILFNFTMLNIIGNGLRHRPKHESLLSPNEIIENRIDNDAINAVNGLYNF